jgi:hypothetical protein
VPQAPAASGHVLNLALHIGSMLQPADNAASPRQQIQSYALFGVRCCVWFMLFQKSSQDIFTGVGSVRNAFGFRMCSGMISVNPEAGY